MDWNVERCLEFSGFFDFLEAAKAGLILLQEMDPIARALITAALACKLARSLQLNYVFGREFVELSLSHISATQAISRSCSK